MVAYTITTLGALKAQLGAGNEMFFILGWDSLAELPRWHEPAQVVRLAYLVAVPRPGYPRPDLDSSNKKRSDDGSRLGRRSE